MYVLGPRICVLQRRTFFLRKNGERERNNVTARGRRERGKRAVSKHTMELGLELLHALGLEAIPHRRQDTRTHMEVHIDRRQEELTLLYTTHTHIAHTQ